MMPNVSQNNPPAHNSSFRPWRLRGLYAITPAFADRGPVLEYAREVLAGGAVALQYREKSDASDKLALAGELRRLCNAHQVPLIINDDIELAQACGADGVHLGRDDGSVREARAMLGNQTLIGVSCYNEIAQARVAAEQGADYVAFGSMYSSRTKPAAVRCEPQVLTEAKAMGLPVVAIGGITLENAPALIEAGADMLAVIGDLAGAQDVQQQARQYTTLWN